MPAKAPSGHTSNVTTRGNTTPNRHEELKTTEEKTADHPMAAHFPTQILLVTEPLDQQNWAKKIGALRHALNVSLECGVRFPQNRASEADTSEHPLFWGVDYQQSYPGMNA